MALQVLKQKYPETLKAIGNALQSQVVACARIPASHASSILPFLTAQQLGSNVMVTPISVKAVEGRRLLQASTTFIATLAVSSTSQAGASLDPEASVKAVSTSSLQSALTTQLKVRRRASALKHAARARMHTSHILLLGSSVQFVTGQRHCRPRCHRCQGRSHPAVPAAS
jgi:hypothetical protein